MTIALSSISNNRTGQAGSSNTAPYAGGGVVNRGNLTLTGSQVSGNRSTSAGGGISNRGTLEITESTIGGNQATLRGGGIAHEEGSGRVMSSTIEGNSAATTGGGLDNRGAFQVISSTIRSNTAMSGGGGACSGSGDLRITSSTIYGNNATSSGGGIACSGSATLEMTLSTISGNTTDGDGGGLSNRDEAGVNLSSTTINRNLAGSSGGGVSNVLSSTVTMVNTILGGNRVSAGGSGPDCAGTLTLTGYNLVQRVGGCTIEDESGSDGGGNVIGEEPWLAPLADYGGPTWTHALHESSPAADAGSCIEGQETDQRGKPRPDLTSGVCDIGAFEADELLPDPPSLSLVKSASRTTARPGTSLAYTILLSATRGTVMTFVTDTLPSGLSFVGTSSEGITYDQETRQVRYSSLITPDNPRLLTYLATIDALAEQGSSLLNNIQATVEDRTVEDSAQVFVQGDLPTPIPTLMPTPEPTPTVSPTPPPPEPALTAISPTTAYEDEGEVSVTISGVHLSEPDRVAIGDADLQGVTLVDDTTIRAVLPAGLLEVGTYDVVVVINGQSLVLEGAFTIETRGTNGERSVYLPLVQR
ncbi:MAG: hypothetical protein HC884_11730 [Chloroflexaceae bacterium]|nr:hypothetical protein [Chloroflexaceae bacterium]